MIFISALWLGILSSISPCPLATNIAAISFLSKRIKHTRIVLWAGIAYTLGRMISYAILGAIIIMSLVSVPFLANFLQKYMNKALGPILFFVGLFLLGAIKFNIPAISISKDRQENLAQSGAKGAFLLGAIFALSFCPISAGLFFGSLIPISLNNTYGIMLPLFYGIGTGLPVLLFTLVVTFGFKSLDRLFSGLKKIEYFARKVTGIIFILVGAYYIWIYLF